jgi:hypothetical protein
MRPRKWAGRQGNDAGYLKNTDVWFNAEVGAGFEIEPAPAVILHRGGRGGGGGGGRGGGGGGGRNMRKLHGDGG